MVNSVNGANSSNFSISSSNCSNPFLQGYQEGPDCDTFQSRKKSHKAAWTAGIIGGAIVTVVGGLYIARRYFSNKLNNFLSLGNILSHLPHIKDFVDDLLGRSSPLHRAVQEGNLKGVRSILKEGEGIDFTHEDSKGKTVLTLAQEGDHKDHPEIAKLLKDAEEAHQKSSITEYK